MPKIRETRTIHTQDKTIPYVIYLILIKDVRMGYTRYYIHVQEFYVITFVKVCQQPPFLHPIIIILQYTSIYTYK